MSAEDTDRLTRGFDVAAAGVGLVVLSPLLGLVAAAIYAYDRHSPFYLGARVGRGGRTFRMVKFRSMRVAADTTGVMSTAGDDPRITPVGHFVRRFKLDELPQLVNIVRGDMSLVGPRPNVESEVSQYTPEERRLLEVRPGATDIASIVFADEAEILRGSADPDRDYTLLIRPWKSRLGLHYIENRSLRLDLELIAWTVVAIVSRPAALRGVERILRRTGAGEELIAIARRRQPLRPAPLLGGLTAPVQQGE